jgi:hypothetical protein
MPASSHDIAHLTGLVEAAKTEAGRLGTDAANVAALLGEALAQLQNIASHGGHPDEGLKPGELNTETDR